MKKVYAIIKNDAGKTCHRISDVVKMALGRNETLKETKNFITENYKDYNVTFIVK